MPLRSNRRPWLHAVLKLKGALSRGCSLVGSRAPQSFVIVRPDLYIFAGVPAAKLPAALAELVEMLNDPAPRVKPEASITTRVARAASVAAGAMAALAAAAYFYSTRVVEVLTPSA